MEQLIKIETNQQGEQLVSARELYEFLEVKAQFTNWCERMFEYGFTENQDYTEVFNKNVKNSKGGRPETDYALTLDCAKEISMLQRSQKGKQARQYFIECEKTLKNQSNRILSPKEMALLVIQAEEEKERLIEQNKLQELELKKQAPKVEYYDEVLQSESTYNTNQIAKELGMSAITLNKLLNTKGVQYKQGGTWLLYSKHQNKGYTKTKTYTYSDSKGDTNTSMATVWTEQGRKFIHQIIK